MGGGGDRYNSSHRRRYCADLLDHTTAQIWAHIQIPGLKKSYITLHQALNNLDFSLRKDCSRYLFQDTSQDVIDCHLSKASCKQAAWAAKELYGLRLSTLVGIMFQSPNLSTYHPGLLLISGQCRTVLSQVL